MDVGLYEVGQDDKPVKVLFKHYGMQRAWKAVKIAGPIDLGAELKTWKTGRSSYRGPSSLAMILFLNGAFLPIWCTFYDIWRSATGQSERLTENGHCEQALADAFEEHKSYSSAELLWVPRELDRKKPLRELSRDQSGATLLQWLSELLVENEKIFPQIFELSAE